MTEPTSNLMQDYLAQNNMLKPKLGIPQGAMVRACIYDIAYTNSANKRAEAEGRKPDLLDGIAVKFAILGYYDKDKYIPTISYENGVITFPCDYTSPEGKVDYAPYITHAEYLNTGRLTSKSVFGGYNNPPDVLTCGIMYDLSFQKQFGANKQAVILELLINTAFADISKDDIAKLGIKIVDEKRYPIMNVYRYLDKKEGEKYPDSSLSTWNRETKTADLVDSEVTYIASSFADALYVALNDRDVAKKTARQAKESFRPTGDFVNVPGVGFATSDKEELIKGAGF